MVTQAGGQFIVPEGEWEDDVNVEEPMPDDSRTLEDILSELQTQTQGMKEGIRLKMDSSSPLFRYRPQDSSASTPASDDEKAITRKTGEAISGGVKGINEKLELISSQLEGIGAKQVQAADNTDNADSSKPKTANASGSNGNNGNANGGKEGDANGANANGANANGANANGKPAKPAKPASALAKPTVQKEQWEVEKEAREQAAKERAANESWGKFTARSRKQNQMLSNKGQQMVDSRIEAIRGQAQSWSGTLHAVGLHGLAGRFDDMAMEGGLLDEIGARLFLPALAVYGGIKLAGDAVQQVRATRNRDIDQSINAGEAIGETAQNDLYDFLHKFHFSAISPQMLDEFRSTDLQNNWQLFSQKGDAYFDAAKTLVNHGWDTAEDKAWAQQMVEMGASAGEVKSQFEQLVTTARTMGISFKNLSGTVAQVATETSKQLGQAAGEKAAKATPEALKELQDFGMRGNKSTFDNLTTNAQFELAERMALAQAGKGQIGMMAGTPGVLTEETLSQGKNMFGAALSIYKNMEAEESGGSEELYASDLATQGIQTNNIMNEQQMFNQSMGTFPAGGSKLEVSISTSPELSAKVSKDNAYAQAIHGNYKSYYNVANYGKEQ